MLRKTLLLIYLLLSSVSYTLAQDIRNSFYYSPHINEGLSQLSVRVIHQDSRGYIWLGTKNGLNRYNGKEYTVYQENPSDSLSLTNSDILSLAEEPGHALWIGTSYGLNRLCQHTNRIRRYLDDKGILRDAIQSVFVDRSGRVWVGNRRGIFLYHREEDRFYPVEIAGDGGSVSVSVIFEDSSGKFWIGTHDDGVYVCDQQMQVISHYSQRTNLALSDNAVSSIYEDHLKQIWVGCHLYGLNCVDLRNNRITHYTSKNSGLKNDFVRCLVEWDGQLLIGTYDGIFALNLTTRDIEKVADYSGDRHSLGHFSVYAFCLSSAKILWIGTYSGGITMLSKLMNRFVRHDPGYRLNIPTGIYSTACADKDGSLWLATEGHGLLNYNPVTQNAEFYLLDRTGPSLHNSNIIKTVLPEDDCIWCGTAFGEIYRFDLRTRKFSLFYKYPESVVIYSLLRDGKGNLWASTIRREFALTCFTTDGKVLDTFEDAQGRKVSMSGIRCLFEEREGVMLIGTRSTGIYRYDMNTGVVDNYRKDTFPSSKGFIPGNYISSIDRTKSGDIWVSTYGSGIFRFDPERGADLYVTKQEGLLDNNICKLIMGRDGNLWMSTSQGVAVYNPKTGKVHNYERGNGVDVREFTLHGGTSMPDGTICFTANNGFITFQPLKMQVNSYIPPIVLEQLSVNNQPISPGDASGILPGVLDDMSEIHLSYNENNISIDYWALNFVFNNMNRYAYRLEGYDTGWNEAGGRTSAYYTNLRPGEYTFHVRASNNDGLWNNEGRSLHIVVHPPIWATWYAYTFYLLVLSCVIYIILFYMNARRRLRENLRVEQLEKRQQEELHQAKLRLFTNFSHELRTPLLLIITPFEEMVKQVGLPGELRERLGIIYKNARKLLLLVNQMMDLQKNQTGNMQLRVSKGNVCEFIKEIYYAFSQVAQTNEIDFRLDCQPEEIDAWYDKSLLEKLVFNLLSNAFKYTPAGKDIKMLVRSYSYEELNESYRSEVYHKGDCNEMRYLMLRIEDSGKGISKEERDKVFIPFYQVPESTVANVPGTGIGLSLVYSIVKLCRGGIFIEDMDHPGACFVVVLPISPMAFKEEEIDTSIGEEGIMDSQADSLDMANGGTEMSESITVAPAAPLASASGVSAPEDFARQKYKILLVEDDKDVREYLHKSLENDYDIIEAYNGVRGYEKAVSHFPDLVLSDIMMPKRNGLELCSMIKNDVRIGHIPVILMTARSMVMHIKEGFSAGADDYIIKPFNMDVLRLRIRSLLESRAQLKKLYGKRFSLDEMGIEVVSADERFSQKLFEVIEKNISDQNLGVEMLCQEIGISRANLYRKLKSITELSPTELIRNKRLEIAAKMLKESDMSVSEVAALLGFNSHSYFSNSFKSFYGYTPTEFIQKKQTGI